jgi:riboflavin synthase
MFTGIIQAVGQLGQRELNGTDARLYIHTKNLDLTQVQLGDSIAVSGVCLTVVTLTKHGFWTDVSAETLAHTILGELSVGSRINLEKALTLQTPLGGHLVSGHVDGVGTITRIYPEGRSTRLHLQVPHELTRYIASKGSICIDGVSLTVNAIQEREFTVNIIPHTMAMTTLSDIKIDRRVNLEVDIIARYLERLLLDSESSKSNRGITEEFLRNQGFIEYT